MFKNMSKLSNNLKIILNLTPSLSLPAVKVHATGGEGEKEGEGREEEGAGGLIFRNGLHFWIILGAFGRLER